MSTSRARVSLLLAITFLAGLAAGVAADRQLAGPAGAGATSSGGSHVPERTGFTIERFADELGLTDSQRAEIAPVLEETKQRMSELFAPVRPAYGELVESARAKIEAVLTAEQVEQYRRLLEREYGSRDEQTKDRTED
ncbi:MAG: hypothetical protein E4H28_06070 [Gemmatimonadales bacterium]|nr:MAG: hypothetical protein E4H28_06070 [Gemmatimonadales bacterium]